MRCLSVAVMLFVLTGALDARAADTCRLQLTNELPVTMYGQRKLRPVVDASINGVSTQLEFDTGAVSAVLISSLSGKFSLTPEPLPPGVMFTSGGQPFDANLAKANIFKFGNVSLSDDKIVVTDTVLPPGVDGVLGSTEMGEGTLEIDLPGGAIRFFEPCNSGTPVYWASNAQVIDLEPMTPTSPRIFGMVNVNGVALRALFDTGSPTTLLTAAAAKKAGVTPTTPSVVESGFSQGIGPAKMKQWTGQFSSIAFGTESWPNPKLDFAVKPNASADLIVGADFFKTHRVIVSKRTSKMYFTYFGGSLFGSELGRP